MKLGTFIVAALCVGSVSQAHADDKKIESYRHAYEQKSDPHLLTLIADEYRAIGKAREALDYYCSYIYIDAAGDDADDASTHARELAKKLGRSSGSDHDACSKTAAPQKVTVTGVDSIGTTLPPLPSHISKREVIGLSVLAVGVAGLGAALYEGREVARVRGAQAVNDPTVDQEALAAKGDMHVTRQKLWLAGGGATMIAGGLLYAITRYERLKADKLMIAPTASKNGGGLVVGRAF